MGCAAACEPAEQGKVARYCGYVELVEVLWRLEEISVNKKID